MSSDAPLALNSWMERIEATLDSISDEVLEVSGKPATIGEGVANGVAEWFHEHELSLGDIFREAVEKAVQDVIDREAGSAIARWLEDNDFRVIEAIREAASERLARQDPMKANRGDAHCRGTA